jgi:photosystem II stability/assembly factor-like uncharacterized protein
MNDYLDRVEAQLTELTERGAHRRLRARASGFARRGAAADGPRRPRRGSEVVAFAAAFAVAVAVAAIVVLNVHGGKPHRTTAPAAHSRSVPAPTSTATPPTTTSGKPVPGTVSIPIPVHFYPQSFTAISELTWWVLGKAPCTFAGEKAPCGEILRTTDGGRKFIGIQAPHATLATFGAQTSGYSQIRFGDTKSGFAYGPDLYATHDGGVTWQLIDVGGTVTDLAISAGQVFATVEPVRGGNGRLVHSPVSHDDWTTVSAAGVVSGGLWVQGPLVIVQSGSGTGIGSGVLVSQDGGTSFATHPAPSPGLPCQFEAPTPPVVWARCATGTESGVWRSTDLGAHFTAAVTNLSQPNSAAFAAASATTAVYGYRQLSRTADAGATWTPVAGPPGITFWAYLGFTDATHGVGLGFVGPEKPANERLYYTTDGGQSYHLVPLP